MMVVKKYIYLLLIIFLSSCKKDFVPIQSSIVKMDEFEIDEIDYKYLSTKSKFKYKKIKLHNLGIKKRFPNLPENLIENSWSGIVSRSGNSSQIFEKISENIFVAGCYNGSGIGVGTLFGEQIAIKASNENTKEIETIEARNKPTWLPPDPILSLGVRARLIYERFRAKSEI